MAARRRAPALVVNSPDPAALASAIERILADEGLAARLRRSASELVFGWDEIVEAVIAPALGPRRLRRGRLSRP